MNPGYFPLAATALKPQQMLMPIHIFPRVWGPDDILKHQNSRTLFKTVIILQRKYMYIPNCAHITCLQISSKWVCVIYFPCKPFYNNSKEAWLHKRDSFAPSLCSESGHEHWQRLMRFKDLLLHLDPSTLSIPQQHGPTPKPLFI